MIEQMGQCGLSLTLLRLSCLFLLLSPIPVSAKFYEPSTEREVWKVGEVHKIPYDTKITNYSIAIWQILEGGDKGRQGPVLVRNENGPETVSEFEWTVQLYRFNLTLSNYFYFLLREGGPDNQANTTARFVSSPYFNISDDTVTSSSTTTSTPASVVSTTLSTSISTTSPTISQAPIDNKTPPPASTGGGGGLSVGAQAGIGVGVSIVGLIAIFCAILWYRYLKKKRAVLSDLQKRATMSQPPGGSSPWETQTVHLERNSPWKTHHVPYSKVPRSPSELPTTPHPVEMPT